MKSLQKVFLAFVSCVLAIIVLSGCQTVTYQYSSTPTLYTPYYGYGNTVYTYRYQYRRTHYYPSYYYYRGYYPHGYYPSHYYYDYHW